jgi:sugar lactone lactonase YvrE
VRTLAGRALQHGATDGPAGEARFNDPAAIAADQAGNLYVADTRNHVIRRISTTAAVTTITASNPSFDTPSGLAISPQGIYVADTGNHIIRRINVNGSITTIAGSPGQSGPEHFDSPLGLALSTNGILYVADCGNHLIRAIAPDGSITTIAGKPATWGSTDGDAANARFNGPVGLALDSQGNLFISDSNNHAIRKITPAGRVTTLAGRALQSGFTDGPAQLARFFQPAELAFDPHGALYVADSMNHAIRKISSDGNVSTVTGLSNIPGALDGDNGAARLYNPYGLAFLPSGKLAITDAFNQTVRAAIPPAQLQISPAGHVTWNAVIGATYQVQLANPALDIWSAFGAPIIAKNLTGKLETASGQPLAFFRVITLP